MSGKTAYVTGGASGIGRAVTEMLASKGCKVCVADMNYEGAKSVAESLRSSGKEAMAVEVNAGDWDSQVAGFEKALKEFGGRIDLVYPIAGISERNWLPNDPNAKDWIKPDLGTLDIDLNGVLYTAALAIQQMRKQEKDADGFRGKIAATASICGFYCVPTIPIYTAAKHGVMGFVRSFGKYLPEEGITMNAVCPNVIRTNISSSAWYEKLDKMNLITPMKGVVDAFASFIDSDISGECMEVGPNGGFVRRAPAEHLDKETTTVLDLLYHRSHHIQEPVKS